MIRLILFVILMYGCLADTVQQIAAKYNGGKRDFETLVGSGHIGTEYKAGMATGTAKRFAEGNFECPAWVRKSERISSDSPCCWANEELRVSVKKSTNTKCSGSGLNTKCHYQMLPVTNHWGRYRKPKSDDCERCDNGNLLSGNCDICNVETACNYNSVSGAVDVQSNSLFAAMEKQPCLYPSNPCDTCKGRDSNTIKDNDDDDDGICDAQDTDCADSTACNYEEPGPCVYKTGCETCNTIGWNDDDLDGTCNVDELCPSSPSCNNLGTVFSVDWYGDKIASGSKDNTVRVWNSTVLDSNALIKTLTGHGEDVLSVSFSPDGLYIVSGSKDNTVRVWNTETGEQIQEFVHNDSVRSVDWYGDKIVSGAEDKTVRVWNTTGNLLSTFTHDNWVLSVSWSPDGRYVASGSRDHKIYVWDTVAKNLTKVLYGHDDWVNSVSWSPNGTYIISGSDDQSVKVWNVTSGERVKGIIRHTSGVESVSFSPDGSHIVSGSSDKYIYIYNWDGTSHTLNATLEGEDTGEFLSLDWSSDGTKLVSGGGSVVYGSDDVRVWEWEQGVHSKLLFDDHIIQDDAACGTEYSNARLCEVCDRTLDNDEDLVCNEDEIRGCMDDTMCGYNPDATHDTGCTNPRADMDCYGDPIYTHRQVYVEYETSFVLQETSATTTFQCKSSRSECTECAYCDASCTYNGQWKTVKTGEHANGFNKYKYMCACNQGYGGNYCQYHEKCNYRGEYEETTEDSMYKGGRCYCNRDIKGSQEQYGGTHCEKPATCWGYNEECYGGTCVLHSDPECKWNSGDGMYWTSKNYYNGFEKLNQQWKNECEFNTCRCDTGWTGKYCAEQTCDKCVHGRCHRTNEFEHNVRNLKVKTYDTMCVCNWGWGGEHCDKETNPKLFNHGHAGECFEGYSGDQCTKCSNCNGQTCHENSIITGYRGGSNDNFYVVNDIRVYDDNAENSVTNRTCTCSNGKTPISRCYCEKNQCNGHGYCDAGTDGHCVCDKGWLGEYCTGQGICADDGCTCQLDDTDEPNRPGCREEDCTYTPGTAVFGSDPVMECTECKLGFTNDATEKTNATNADDECSNRGLGYEPCCNDNACESSLCPENSTCIGWKKNNKENIQCSDHSKTTETSCLAPKGVWTPACSISYISNQAECVSTSANTWTNEGEFLFVCSDPQFMDETSCLAPKGTWDSTCSISHISNHAECESTSVNTWDTSKAIALGTYTCGCYPRLTGDNCDIDCCERNDPVTNTGFLGAKVNGVCKQTVGGCRCDDGYEGYHCQCSDALCVNGHCNPKVENENFDSTVDGAMCICYPGYQVNQTTGVCDVDIDECAVTSCDHGVCEDGPCVYGKCRDGPGSFECKCKVGYIGDRCQDSTGWKTGATTCEDNKYLVEERCLDCPVGTYSNDVADTQCRVKLNDLNIRDAVSNTSHEYYGDIEDFDTSEVTNMDELFMNRAVPDISKWDVSAVTSMRNMFAGSTGTFVRTSWNLDGKDITNIYAGSDMQDAEGKNLIQAYPPCNGTNIKCMHNGLLCVSGVIVYDTCKVDSQALETMVGEWEAGATKSDVLYGPLKDWDVHYVTDMTTLFTSGNPDIRQWDMSNVVHADGMLFASSFNHPVDNKDFSSLQTAKLMFPQGYSYRKCGKHFARARANVPVNERFGEYGKCLTTIGNNNIYAAVEGWFAGTIDSSKYGDMPDWDVSEVISMVDLFMNKINIPSLAKWDTGKVTSMKGMFQLSDFNEDIRHWDVRKVTTFEQMFKGNTHFAVDLTSWELHIGDTDKMFMGNGYYFPGTTAFNIDNTLPTALDDGTFPGAITGWFGDDKTGTLDTYGNISDWLTFKVTNMKEAFLNQQFNGDISRWVVSSVTDMSSMFEGSTFNGDISTWEVVNVENMKSMFKNSSFNQMIDRWNVSSVTDMSYMFQDTDFSRPIDSWDLFGTEPLEARAPGGPTYCIKTEGKVVDVVGLVGRAARRKCFDECTNVYPFFLPDIEGRSRNRSGGRVGGAYTPYLGGFGEVTSQNYNHTCMCIDEKAVCGTKYDPVPPFDYVYEYLDLVTTGMFDNNEAFVQPLCGLGWRYRDLDSLSKHQKQVSFTCDICAKGQHMSECGLCMGEFRFDKCMDSTRGYTLSELHQINPNLLLDNGNVLNSDSEITATTKVNPYACNCKYEGGLRGCLVVNGRKQVRIKEWYVWGEEDFSGHSHINDDTEYYCEVDFLDGREVATAKGFNSVTCTEDTLLTREECGLVGGNWDGQCDKCLEPCDPPELGVKFFSKDRECEVCDAGKTVFQNECVFCPDGQFTSEDYAYCGKCPMGTFGEDGDCTTCDYGKASTFEGAVRCDTCPNDHYSVGTSCEDCLTGKTSEAGDRTCKDKAHCWRGNTTENLGVGNYCSACEEGFELVDNTCVSKCKGDLVKQGETLTCTRSGDGGRWTGPNMDDCPADNDFRYMGLCADRPCTQARVTDCLCGGSGGTIVKNNETEACYIDAEVNLCYNSVISNCLCDMGGDMGGVYEWVSEGSCWGFCSSPDIIVESTCESTSVNTWTGGCSDPSLKTEEACLVMGSMVQTCSNGATIADCGNTSNTWDVTTGCSDPQYTDNDNCTANVGVIYDKCDIPDIYTIAGCVTTIKNTWDGLCSDARYLSQVTCEEEKHVWGDKRILDDCPSNMIPGQPCTDSSIKDACTAGVNTAAKCAGFQCTTGDFADGGACCSDETPEVTECMLEGVYVNLATQMIYDSVIHPKCGGTTLENCYASPWTMHDVLIDCHGHECPQNHHVVVGNHCVGFGCDFDASCCDWNQQCSDRRCSDRDGYKVADINPDTYASTAVFTYEFEGTCCDYDQMCNSTDFSCTFLADDFCDGDCTQTDFQPTEDSKSTCCTDASWHCESGTCPEGWLVNTEYCGEKCSDYAATFTGVKELVDVELNGRAVECSKTLQQIQTILSGHDGDVNSLSWSPDGSKFVSGSDDDTLRVWDVATGNSETPLGGVGDVLSVDWSPDGTKLVSGHSNNYVRVWDATSGEELYNLKHSSGVLTVSWSPDGTKLASGSFDRTVRVWNSTSGDELHNLGHSGWVRSVSFSPDGTKLVSGCEDYSIRIWDLQTENVVQIYPGDIPRSVVWSPDGSKVIAGLGDNTIRVYTLNGDLLKTISGHENNVLTISLSPDGTKLVSGSHDSTMRVWNVTSGDELINVNIGAHVLSVSWSPDGAKIVSGSAANIRVWNAETGKNFYATPKACSSKCNDFFQMVGEECYCTDTGPCEGPKDDCSDWCTSLATMSLREFPFHPIDQTLKDYVVCEHRVNGACPLGWATDTFTSGGYTRQGCIYGIRTPCSPGYTVCDSVQRHSSAGDCYESGTCCSVSYQSYEKRELDQRISTTCCDIDTDKDVCERYDCPYGYKYVDGYERKFFETHAFDCCVKIPDTHYCNIFNSGTPYVCPNEHKYNHSALYCGKECDETTCCTPNNHFCDIITCNAISEAATSVDYCGGVCTDQCCQKKPMCDRSYNCKENVDSNSRIDWQRYCDVADNEVCASSEYELGKCCTTSTTSCYQDTRFQESVSDTVHYQGSEPYYVGNQMPNCDSYGGHISYYEKYGRTGGSFTAESFATLCCNYVEVCPEQHTCENIDGSPSFLKAKFKDNVSRYCASGSYSYWDRIQGCDNNYSECCERETCGSASNRLGEYCNEPLVSWSQYWDIYLQELLTSDNFFSTCCQS